ncbi:MAG TPA: YcgL domain-containing protein [Chromatiaceae bacterium]|jgi:uncharacterized protein YcgL (UPF0745 family)|nr:YcgL domain-containing protein [Chromatiaceae bacterium]HIB85121.1 YcgL domain-containing protein [Chromatiaceae bacterium]HIN82548.1 YcgL domain-containing protein [Chromatiales bacterium]HIO13675.1 YcgL domain-containing protein [Chromatiales bacterium]HIO54909.1 YcgL domain-containing protein [Chromatiales bacterium]
MSDTPCWIYRSSKKNEMYLYVVSEHKLQELPAELMRRFGEPQFVMQLDLNLDRSLARADVATVIDNLQDKGFHLQMPPTLEPDLYYGNED